VDCISANRKCPNHSSTGKGKLKAKNKKCHNEKTAPTKRPKMSPMKINFSTFLNLLRKKANHTPRRKKGNNPDMRIN
jgi:hypothetical protein